MSVEYHINSGPKYISIRGFDTTGGPILRAIAEASLVEFLVTNNEISSSAFWYLNRIVIQPELFRGHGIGSTMLKMLQEQIKLHFVKKLVVEPGGYGSDVDRLITFYEIHGFKSTVLNKIEPFSPVGAWVWEAT